VSTVESRGLGALTVGEHDDPAPIRRGPLQRGPRSRLPNTAMGAGSATRREIPLARRATNRTVTSGPSRRVQPVDGRVQPLSRYCVIDVETTGLDPAVDRVVEIAVVEVDGSRLVERDYVSLVRAPVVGCTAIHGIAPVLLARAPTFGQIARDVARRLAGDVVIIGHNVSFDVSFVRAEFERAGLAAPIWPTLCTMTLGHRLGVEPERRNLAAACARRGIEVGARHSALGDARATAQLLLSYIHDPRVPELVVPPESPVCQQPSRDAAPLHSASLHGHVR
jgi:DNA polymerase III epsilon subunit family exonuclease